MFCSLLHNIDVIPEFFVGPGHFDFELRVKDILSTQALVTWSKLPIEKHNGFLTGYLLVLTWGLDVGNIVMHKARSHQDSYLVENLEPCTEYRVKIAATNSYRRGHFSPSVTFTTMGGNCNDVIHTRKLCKDVAPRHVLYF